MHEQVGKPVIQADLTLHVQVCVLAEKLVQKLIYSFTQHVNVFRKCKAKPPAQIGNIKSIHQLFCKGCSWHFNTAHFIGLSSQSSAPSKLPCIWPNFTVATQEFHPGQKIEQGLVSGFINIFPCSGKKILIVFFIPPLAFP